MDIVSLINQIKSIPNCKVLPPKKQPTKSDILLPADLSTFFKLSGGIELFWSSDFHFTIVSPSDFNPANPLIIGEIIEDDISSDWYIIAHDNNGDYLVIDLNKGRLGRCYDGHHETYGIVGETPIIATSFTDLLQRLVRNNGRYPYWLDDGFIPLGDAYTTK